MWNSTLVQLKVNSRGCPSKDRLSLLYLFVYSNSVLSRSSLQRYSNRKMCWINLHVIHMLIGIWLLCLSSLSFKFFIYIAIVILGKMDCLENCAQTELRLIISYITTVQCCSPMKQGIFLWGLLLVFFHLSFSGTPGSDIDSPQTWRKGTSKIQQPTTNAQYPSESMIFVT